jgi:1-phosphofructokinase family hexose kinase
VRTHGVRAMMEPMITLDAGDERPALLFITPSPAIDRTAHVERLVQDVILRPTRLVASPGGKGVNAARAALRLGGHVTTTGLAGGHAGRWIVEELAAERMDPRFAPAAAESRTTYVVVDPTGASVIVYERAAPVRPDEWAAFLRLLEEQLLPACGRAVVAGSLPGGIAPESYADIVVTCRRADRPLLVDASGAGLLAALSAGPDVVKIGLTEAHEAGLVSEMTTALDAASMLVERGARLAVVTDGSREVAAADHERAWRATVPRVEAVNAVGSGDSFNAAFSLALLEGEPVETALRRGVAAGSANALALSAGMPDAAVARQLEAQVTVTATGR